MNFPFGKHQGVPMDEVPLDYLQWALDNMTKLRPDTKAAIKASVARREAGKSTAGTNRPATAPAPEGGVKTEHGDVEVDAPCPGCGEQLHITISVVPF